MHCFCCWFDYLPTWPAHTPAHITPCSVAGLVGALMGHIAASVAEEAARGNDQVEEVRGKGGVFCKVVAFAWKGL